MTTLIQQAQSLITGEENLIANLANISALLMDQMDDINWVGFYLFEESSQELVLGPFQGKPACIRISPGKGVCGTAFEREESIRVDNVDDFPGHIVCDVASQSELVVPLRIDNRVLGVLDIDSPSLNRFTEKDQEEMEALVQIFN